MNWRGSMAAVAMIVAGAAADARADTIALTFTGGTLASVGQNATLGWEFSVSSPITVTSLGFWDNGSDGLLGAHNVAIWNSGGTLLMSATVQAGTADPLTSGFRFNSASLSGTTALAAGNYVIGAFFPFPTDSYMRFVSGANVTTASEVTIGNFRETTGGSLAFPTGSFPVVNYGAFGPNFQFTSAIATPEPGTTALFGLGTAALAAGILRRRRAAKRATATRA